MEEYTDLDEALANPEDVTELSLGESELTNLPSEIGQLINLGQIDRFGNNLAELPIGIGQLPNLINLNLARNSQNILDKQETSQILEFRKFIYQKFATVVIDIQSFTQENPQTLFVAELEKLNAMTKHALKFEDILNQIDYYIEDHGSKELREELERALEGKSNESNYP